MADKVDKKPVSVEKKKKAPQLPTVELVCLWALHSAAMYIGSFIFAAITLNQHHSTTPSSWLGEELTGAAAAEETAIRNGTLWCSAAQAAAAVLALLLPERRGRSRRALAYAALEVAAASHLMTARVVTLYLTADPGAIFWWIAGTGTLAIMAAADVNCFMALLGRKEYADVPAVLFYLT